MGRKPGTPNRNYPEYSLGQALTVASAIQDGASGMPVSRLTLSELVGRSPNASQFRKLLLASRAYGLTTGGVNAEQFDLTQLGDAATSADEIAQTAARRKAVMNIEPYRVFLTAYNGKKVPSPAAFREFLVAQASVPEGRADDCIEHILADAREVGFIRRLSSGEYVDLEGVDPSAMRLAENGDSTPPEAEDEEVDVTHTAGDSTPQDDDGPVGAEAPGLGITPRKVFVAHGKDREPLGQLKRVLDQFKVKYAVAIDEPHKGRPISTKVASLMRDECSSAIFIFTADEAFVQRGPSGDEQEIWRPSENLVYELGAASVLYDRRIVIFKDKRVTFPSDFADLGYIEFEPGQLAAEMGTLFAELVSLDILEVRAKG
jgi:Predicted nucleotide-binding protein containing TIR-like domain